MRNDEAPTVRAGLALNDERMTKREFFVAQPSWLWGREASCLSKSRRRDAFWPHRLEACATFTL